MRNSTRKLINVAKQNHIKEKIESSKDDIKKLWKSLKDFGLTGKTKKSSCNIGLMDENTNEINFDKKYVSNKFNSFFCNIAKKLVDKLPSGHNIKYEKVSEFYKNKGVTDDKLKLKKMSEDEICKLLNKLNVAKATGHDGLSARFLKDGASIISSPLTYVINLSLECSQVPNAFKTAKVLPLFKKGDRNNCGNYRPVSILPVVSKIFERVVCNQLQEYLYDNNLLYVNQSGFRKHHSTDTALISLSNMIFENMDQGNFTGLILLDLQKAFDTVNHEILLHKLKLIGACPKTVTWFKSYLTGRSQFVDVGRMRSDPDQVVCGVPQGSILGPVLFLLYLNDMSTPIDQNCSLFLYADDSALAVSSPDINYIQERLSTNMNSLSGWLLENKLSLHLGKTECILFGNSKKLSKAGDLDIVCNGVKIQNTKCIKYLGCFIDNLMSGTRMYENTIKKINNTINFLYRNKQVFNQACKKMLINSLVQP